MRTHHSHPGPRTCLCLVFEPNRLEQAALEAAYQRLVPRVRRATALVPQSEDAAKTTAVLRREQA
jgi:hypothetical protein